MMKLVQKILSHGLFIASVVAAFFIYSKRADLFPQWFTQSGAPVSVAASEQQPPAPARSVSRPKPEKVISKQPVAPLEQQAVPPEDAVVVPNAAAGDGGEPDAAVPAIPGADRQTPAAGAAADADVASTPRAESLRAPAGGSYEQQPPVMPQPQASAAERQPAGAVDAEHAAADLPATPAPASEGAAATAPQQTADEQQLRQQLEEARVLYWRRDMRGAASLYQSLSQAYPDNADVWGEAGNFYYSLKQREPAADAYYHAVDLLIEQGKQQRARQLLDVMHQLDEEKARALETRLQQ